MTATEQAIELVDKYQPFFVDYVKNTIDKELAKRCALIAVDLILNESLTHRDRKFWEEVKQIIQKL